MWNGDAAICCNSHHSVPHCQVDGRCVFGKALCVQRNKKWAFHFRLGNKYNVTKCAFPCAVLENEFACNSAPYAAYFKQVKIVYMCTYKYVSINTLASLK